MAKSGFMKDAMVLFAITLVAGLALGFVNDITKEPIAKAQMAAKVEAYKTVYADAADFKAQDALTTEAASSAETLADKGWGNVFVADAVEALDASGAVIGHVVNSTSKDGYGGNIEISVGVSSEGTVTGIAFLSISETPGLGMRATEEGGFKEQFAGKTAESFELTKSGASADNQIDAMSGATITSSAVTNAVNAAVYFANNCTAQ